MPRDFGLKDTELAKLRQLFESLPELEAVYVFGSRARGDHKGTSDVDLAVRTSANHSRVTSRLKGELEEMNIIHRFDVVNLADLKEGSDFAKRAQKEMRVMWRRGWVTSVVGKYFDVKNGKSNSEDAVENGRYPLFDRSTEIKASDRYLFDSPAIIIPGEGKEFIPRFYSGKFDLHQRAYAITPKTSNNEVDIKYLYFYMVRNREYLERVAVGSTVRSLRMGMMTEFPLEFPPLPEQKRIAEILSSLDDKIELNRQMNKTLEQIAQALFKHWFIDFEFPNEQGQPYKSTGGKMVASELGLIPAGWKYDAIGNHVKIVGGTTPSTTKPEFWNGDVHWTSPKDLSAIDGIYLLTTDKKITEAGLTQIGSGSLASGTLLMSSRAPIGYLAFSAIPVAINQGYIAFLNDGSLPNSYMYFWLKLNMDLVIASANGSTFLEISKSNFKEINACVPSLTLAEQFDSEIAPLLAMIKNSEEEVQQLLDVLKSMINTMVR
jgi:type I restriction enzyme S subunit